MRIIRPAVLPAASEKTLNRRVVRKKIGQKVVLPGNEMADYTTTFYHNFGPDVRVYIKKSNGLVIPMRYLEMDVEERGVYIFNTYPSLQYRSHSEDDKEIIRNSIRASSVFLDIYGDTPETMESVIKNNFVIHIGEIDDGLYDRLRESIHQEDRDLYDYFVSKLPMLETFMIPVEMFRDDNHIMLENYDVMISINDHKTPYPQSKDYNSVDNGVAITIHNSQNPTKIYYSKIAGEIMRIPVKNDNKREDGIVIVNKLNGNEEVKVYPLEDAEMLGIYSNIEDAEHNGDSELQLKLKEMRVRLKELDSKDTSNAIKIELEQMKMDIERQKAEHAAKVNEYELEKMKKDEELERIKRLYEEEKMKHDLDVNRLKREIEESKARASEAKSKSDTTSSIWKAVGAVVAGIATIATIIWKIFF